MKPSQQALHLQITKDNATLKAEAGEIILLQGDVGSGKSHWLKIIAGLAPAPHGVTITAAEPLRMLFDRHPPCWLGQQLLEELSFGLRPQPSQQELEQQLQFWGLDTLPLEQELHSLNRLQSIQVALASAALAAPAMVLIDAVTDPLPQKHAMMLAAQICRWSKQSATTVVIACNRYETWLPLCSQCWHLPAAGEMPQVRNIYE